jgi:hypothetical protein
MPKLSVDEPVERLKPLERMDKLLELAERCEAAEGADRELDIAIALGLPSATYGDKAGRFYNAGPYYDGADDRIGFEAEDGSTVVPGGAPDMLVRPYTASLDAAMTLVPEGHKWVVQQNDSDKPGRQHFAELRRGHMTSYDKAFPVWATTPALALCAAALRARASANREK